MLQNIKEIVGGNFSDDEIYAMLKECNMDPSEAVHRLLNQGNYSGVRMGHPWWESLPATFFLRLLHAANYSKPMAKRETGINAIPTSSVSVPVLWANCDSVPLEAAGSSTLTPDNLSSQYSTGVQNAWTGMAGQRTLADIVKMGRPPGKVVRAPVAPTNSDSSHDVILPTSQHFGAKAPSSLVKPSESHRESSMPGDSNILFEQGDSVAQHLSHDEWLLVDQPKAGTGSSLLETRGTSGGFADPSTSSNLPVDGIDLHHGSQLDEIRVQGNIEGVILAEDSSRPITTSDRQPHLDNSRRDSGLDGGSTKDTSSFQSEIHNFEHNEVDVADEEVSAATSNLRRLTLEKEDASVTHAEDNPAVIIPNHLQVTNADCSYLSFGTFGSGINAAFSGPFASKAQNSNLDVPCETSESTPVDDSDARNSEYFSNEHLGVTLNENAEDRSSPNVESYEAPSSSQPDVVRSENTDAMDGLQYRLQSSIPGYTFSNTGNRLLLHHMPLCKEIHTCRALLLSQFLARQLAGVSRPTQEYDLPHSSLLATQSMPTKYSTAMSSISGPPSPCQRYSLKLRRPPPAFRPDRLFPSTCRQFPSTLQPTLPLGHFANMISYPPYLPPSYTYMPSAAAAASSRRSPAAPPTINLRGGAHAAGLKYTLPQYKNSTAVGNLPLSAAVPSGLAGFGGSPSMPGNLLLNPSGASVGSVAAYDDILNAQYKEQSQYAPPQQARGRAVSGLSGGAAYYNLHQGPNQHGGFRQSQQPSPYGGAAGYPNFYLSQGSATGQQEHLQSPGDARLSGSQGPAAPPAAAHQMWQHNY
ncbi:unnamed protein product [Spirodela intermedia]|uniref:GBF-interacting protein 1 N-terminal domain-containing protein n=1 Tax=Spirodela intermedia TaxID=51605 RepID=A0A7I8JMB3_SPIIN|nr:unnamed protein product [Spirodela intermedia]CAA6671307.1 unnamed protein product [Spirodela intermedia]